MSAHAKRRARTRRRFAAIGTIYAAALNDIARQYPLLGRLLGGEVPTPEYALSPVELRAEFELIRVGQRRKSGRPAKPANSNDSLIALLREHRADDFKGRFTLKRAKATQKWLRQRGEYKSVEAITRMVNRAKRAE